jgi:hypothetical protein
MELLRAWLALVLATYFIIAFGAHVRDPKRFERALAELGLTPGLRIPLTVADGAIGVSLLVTPQHGAVVATAYLVLASFVLWRGIASARPLADCGCGLDPQPVDRALLVRNASLIAAAVAVLSGPVPSLAEPLFWMTVPLLLVHVLVQSAIVKLSRSAHGHGAGLRLAGQTTGGRRFTPAPAELPAQR